MPSNGKTIFQNLSSIMGYTRADSVGQNEFLSQGLPGNEILFATNSKEEYEKKLNQYKQEKYLAYQWQRSAVENNMESLASYTAVKLMYRDCDLMDGVPEIGTALDIIADEVCNLSSDNQILKVSSKSKRIKSILEDLFYNRLKIATTLRMITRGMVKYGNHYMLLNVTKDGIAGWRQLSVYETDRYEGGLNGYYGGGIAVNAGEDLKADEVRFVHAGMNQATAYQEWQVAHFRLLNDSFFLPYGVSLLHKARRAWRMWSMMEDAMLIYRLDKSIERRVFKIYVGGINDQDVPAFVQDIANNFKRTPIIDPATGQVDLRKNFLDVSADYFIPVRDPSAPNPIETLQGAQNQTAMDDINYMQNKIFAAIRVPKQFINFQDAQGKGQNLSLADIRFARMVMGVQQFLLAELNKVAMTHLYLLGFKDELSNFSLAMNIPTAQIEQLELDALGKRIQTASQALADPGIGMPLVSLHWALTNIMKLSDSEIKDMLGEIRLEKAMAAELQMTPAIIKEAFEKTRKARLYILDEIMLKAIPEVRETVSEYAPKMLQTRVPVDKIREVIGSGGKVIQKISAECDVKIDINEDGSVFVSGIDLANARKAIQIVDTIANGPEIGAIYKGKVTGIQTFGAFVEIVPGKEGLVHISKLDKQRVEKTEDVVSLGDEIVVKVMEIDEQKGKISLSRKDALAELEARKQLVSDENA